MNFTRRGLFKALFGAAAATQLPALPVLEKPQAGPLWSYVALPMGRYAEEYNSMDERNHFYPANCPMRELGWATFVGWESVFIGYTDKSKDQVIRDLSRLFAEGKIKSWFSF